MAARDSFLVDELLATELAKLGVVATADASALGEGALPTPAANPGSVAVGPNALANAAGVDNTVVGANAGTALTTGGYNTLLGAGADVNSATAAHRIALGAGALAQADNELAVDPLVAQLRLPGLTVSHGAATPLTIDTATGVVRPGPVVPGVLAAFTGASNSGFGVGTGGDVGADNTLVGVGAAATIAGPAARNVAVGRGSLSNLTTGSDNIAIGRLAGVGVSTGSGNVCIGSTTATTGANPLRQIALGFGAIAETNDELALPPLLSQIRAAGLLTHAATAPLTSDGAVLRLSTQPLLVGVTGASNTGIGQGVGTGGLDNTFVGVGAGSSVTLGVINTALGRLALSNLTTGDQNVSIGGEAGRDIGTGRNNVAVGTFAMISSAASVENVAIGSASLLNSVGCVGNVSVGTSSGSTITNGTNNTCIGDRADVNSAAAAGRIALGASAVALADNELALPGGLTQVRAAGLAAAAPTAPFAVAWDGDLLRRAEQTTHSSTFTLNATTSAAQAMPLTRAGPVVFLTLTTFTVADAGTPVTMGTALPAGYRPAADTWLPLRVTSGGAAALGAALVTAAGALTIYADAAGAPGNFANPGGPFRTTLSFSAV